MDSTEATSLLEAIGTYGGSVKKQDELGSINRDLQRFARWCGADRALSSISPSEVGEYAELIGGSGTSPQAQEHLQAIRGFFSYARKKKLIDRNLAQHVRIRKRRSRSANAQGPSTMERVELTAEGHGKLIEQVERLRAERAPLAKQIQRAAADKDFRENAPLEAARERLGHVESRIRALEATVRAAVIMRPGEAGPAATVKLGSRVSVKDVNTGRKMSYTLVSRSEANPSEGKISDVSPLGQALVNKSPGQEVESKTPRGKMRYRILEVSS